MRIEKNVRQFVQICEERDEEARGGLSTILKAIQNDKNFYVQSLEKETG